MVQWDISKNPKINSYGDKYWYNKNKELHSFNDQPAVINFDGSRYWYQNGKIHRLTGPAVIYSNGIKAWYIDGKYIDLKKYGIDHLSDEKISKKLRIILVFG